MEVKYLGTTKELVSCELETFDNGMAIKFSNGLMIQTMNILKTVSTSTQWGSVYRTGFDEDTGNFNVPFSEIPTCCLAWTYGSTNATLMTGIGRLVSNIALPKFGLIKGSSPSITGYISCIAIGRWK
mgnify:CR=1 FL=1